MKKYLHIAAKVLFSLILVLPIVGATGVLGEATRDLYNTDQAYDFIQMLVKIGYINYMMVSVHIVALIALWTKREALAAMLVIPITLNIVAFHLVLDDGLLTGSALLGDILLLLNLYLLWKNRETIKPLMKPQLQ